MYKKLKRITFIALLLSVQNVWAGIIFESANGNDTNAGVILSDSNWVYHNFNIEADIRISSIGGYFYGRGGDVNIFGAIISMSDQWDTPDSYNLSTPDLVATTLFTIGDTAQMYEGGLDLQLNSGWYAIAFGSGAFGADNIDFNEYKLMSVFDNDMKPELTYVGIQEGNPLMAPNQYSYQASNARFVISANSISVPESSTISILILGLLFIGSSRYVASVI